MATEIWCELVCACCARTAGGQYTTNGRLPRRELKADAAAAGWLFKGNEAFCSTEHLERASKESENGND
ncbi:hypothetical protein [Cupriavidus necator]